MNLTAGVSNSKEGAYELGHNLISNIKSETPSKLKRMLRIDEYGLKTDSIKIDSSQVGVSDSRLLKVI